MHAAEWQAKGAKPHFSLHRHCNKCTIEKQLLFPLKRISMFFSLYNTHRFDQNYRQIHGQRARYNVTRLPPAGIVKRKNPPIARRVQMTAIV
jgi:hypothetical protein